MKIDNSKKEIEKNQLIYSKKADNFYLWIFEEIKPSLQGNILELGSGIGNFSKILLENYEKDKKIILTDIEDNYLSNLRSNYGKGKNVSVEYFDLNDIEIFLRKNYEIKTCILINVLEHIEDDNKALLNINRILNDEGRLIILVPALKNLYNLIDLENGHYRRYSKRELKDKAKNAGFKILKLYYFNFFGILGWIFNGKILKKGIINENALGIFNRLIPFFKFFDKHIIHRKIGVSLIAILEK